MAAAKKFALFEKGPKDAEKKGMKEGSKGEKALDKKQAKGNPFAKKVK